MSLIIASSDAEDLGITSESLAHSARRGRDRVLDWRRNDGARGSEDRGGTPSVQHLRALGRTDGTWATPFSVEESADAEFWEWERADEDLAEIERYGIEPRAHVAETTAVCNTRRRRRRQQRTRRVAIDMTGLGSLMTERHGVPL